MNTTKFDNKSTKVVAHRGLSGIERENTNAAFIAAGNRSYFGIETDIHVAKDGEFVVAHDSSMARVSGSSLIIEESTLPMLRSITLYEKNNETKDRYDLRVSTVTEYVRICKTYEKVCVLELKGYFGQENLKRLIEAIKAEDYLDNIIFIAFDWKNLTDLKAVYPEATMQFLCSEIAFETLPELVKNNFSLDINYKGVTQEIIDYMHQNNLVVNVWTVDGKEDAERLAAMGVDQITTNICEGIN